jgi:predicted enzyme related to lactoylglutathione lyase
MHALVVFTPDVSRLAAFYEAVLDAEAVSEPSGDIRLVCRGAEVLIHSVSGNQAPHIDRTVAPARREDASFKPVFDVASVAVAFERVTATGGVITDRTFLYDGLVRHDVVDPDGNVVQLRSARGL